MVDYINSLIANQIKSLSEIFGDSRITLCRSYNEIVEEKSASIDLLWEEILYNRKDDEKYGAESQRSMYFQFKLKYQVEILENFIERSLYLVVT